MGLRIVAGLLVAANALTGVRIHRTPRCCPKISAVAEAVAMLEVKEHAANGLAVVDAAAAARPLLHACGVGAVSNCISQLISEQDELSPSMDLPGAAERWKNRRRRGDVVDVPAAASFGAIVAAACYYYDVPVNQGYVFLCAAVWDAARKEFARLREIDRCTAELRLIVAEVQAAATTGESAEFMKKYNSAESTLLELQTRVADGPLPRGR